MSILLLESPEKVNLLIAFIPALPPVLRIVIFAPLVYMVVLGRRDKPSERIGKIAQPWNRAPKGA